jgi:L-ascorbate metabolism protein UlaG (beta-lactamase superfamily)
MKRLRFWTGIVVVSLLTIAAAGVAILASLWGDRGNIEEFDWQYGKLPGPEAGVVTVLWLGVSTLLFDDGETQILIDGAFSRVDLLDIALLRKVSSDAGTVNYAIAEYHMDRLAAIVPLHSHFDHAMDVGMVANRTSAIIIGSESTANIARGAEVPVDQYQILADGESRQFGDFTIYLLASRHAPIGFGDNPWFPGTIDEPLSQPARVSQWRSGTVYSVYITHPRGTTLVQGSGGFIPGNLQPHAADVVMLSVAGLNRLGQDYFEEYWDETVTAVGAGRVFPIHYDDFTLPFGDIRPFPSVVDDVMQTGAWIDELATQSESPISVQLLPFGRPSELY